MTYLIREAAINPTVRPRAFAEAETIEAAIAYMHEKFNVLVCELDEENDAADVLANFKSNPRHSAVMQYVIEAA